MVAGPGCRGSGARLSWYWGLVVMVVGPGCHGIGARLSWCWGQVVMVADYVYCSWAFSFNCHDGCLLTHDTCLLGDMTVV